MRIWVTRTEPGASRLAEALEAAGHEAWLRPVLRIEQVPTRPPDGAFDLTVFLSEHAVHGALANGWVTTPALAIGPGTQAALAGYGIPATVPNAASSEGIAEFLARDPPARVLLAAGEGGRDVLAGLLGERGSTVAEWDLYRRLPVREPLPPLVRIHAIVAGSTGGLRVAADLWFASGHSAATPLVAPSVRIGDAARALGFEHVFVSSGADADATVATIGAIVSGSVSGSASGRRPS